MNHDWQTVKMFRCFRENRVAAQVDSSMRTVTRETQTDLGAQFVSRDAQNEAGQDGTPSAPECCAMCSEMVRAHLDGEPTFQDAMEVLDRAVAMNLRLKADLRDLYRDLELAREKRQGTDAVLDQMQREANMRCSAVQRMADALNAEMQREADARLEAVCQEADARLEAVRQEADARCAELQKRADDFHDKFVDASNSWMSVVQEKSKLQMELLACTALKNATQMVNNHYRSKNERLEAENEDLKADNQKLRAELEEALSAAQKPPELSSSSEDDIAWSGDAFDLFDSDA
jgi:chromosome segregation ATPase